MAVLVPRSWQDLHACPLTEPAIRRVFQPASDYRISRNAYPSGTKFSGSARAGSVFVLSGKCRTHGVEVAEGQFMECPAGAFDFAVLGDKDVELIQVWLLPPEFRSRE